MYKFGEDFKRITKVVTYGKGGKQDEQEHR
ncbi:MAG: hypothetical protein K0R93_3072 [Anaerosolibacter sp.]|jgi:hypothetical protein|nr:hypothetical protein [Anaerosolibacter sp.]